MELMRRGQKSNAIADLQRRLDSLGFTIALGELGGDFEETTESAVKSLQQRSGLVVDGIVGPDTWKVVVESSWALGDRLLHLSSPHLRGDDVRQLQDSLNALGFNAGKHDGIFGPRTASALRSFQKDLAIDEDGIAGHETLLALQRLQLVTKRGLGARISEREARRAAPPGVEGKRVAVDAGHGGDDPGETSPTGQTEAELAFHLAALITRTLDSRGAQTLLTRGPHDGPTES
ncbi:MAG: peptidoglycan-binding protein, partial [Actinomycetota bacterium]